MKISTDMTDTKPLNGSMGHEGTPNVNLTATEEKYYADCGDLAANIARAAVGDDLVAPMAAAIFSKIATPLYWIRAGEVRPAIQQAQVSEQEQEQKAEEEQRIKAEEEEELEVEQKLEAKSESAPEPEAWKLNFRKLSARLGPSLAKEHMLANGWIQSSNPDTIWTMCPAVDGYDKVFVNTKTGSRWGGR